MFKKYKRYKRYKPLLILITLSVAIFFVAGISYALDSWNTGFRINTETKNVYVGSAQTCYKVTNTSGNSYFIPTKTIAEWNAFNANKPAGVTVSGCAECQYSVTNPYFVWFTLTRLTSPYTQDGFVYWNGILRTSLYLNNTITEFVQDGVTYIRGALKNHYEDRTFARDYYEVCRIVDGCASHDYASCYGNDIYWYDSCGNREGIKQDCVGSEICQLRESISICEAPPTWHCGSSCSTMCLWTSTYTMKLGACPGAPCSPSEGTKYATWGYNGSGSSLVLTGACGAANLYWCPTCPESYPGCGNICRICLRCMSSCYCY